MKNWAFMLIISILWIPVLCDAHITADFTNLGEHHEDKELDGQTWHVHVKDGHTSWWTYDSGKISGIWGQDEVVEPLPTPTPDTANDPVPENRVVPEQHPIAPRETIDRSSNPQPIETLPASVNVPTQQNVEPTDTTESTEAVESIPRRHRSITQPKPLPKLTITHIRLRYKPYTLFVYVKNTSNRFVSGITLEIVSKDGAVTLRRHTDNRDRLWTPQYNHLKDYISPDGIKANNLIAIAPVSVLRKWNYRKETARFRIGVRQMRSRQVWTEDRRIRLLLGDKVVTECPEPEAVDAVMGAPPVPKGNQLATSWASVKKRN